MALQLPAPTVYGELILWELPVQHVAADFLSRGDLVFDVGGNTGGVAIAFSRLVGAGGRVVTFECNPRMIAWIRQDLEANTVQNIEIVTHAASNADGETVKFFLDPSYYGSSSSLAPSADREVVEVSTITLDTIWKRLGANPAFIKIDVEGFELAVLQGAQSLIETVRPAIVFEYSPNAPDPVPFLDALGYTLYDINTYAPVRVGDPREPFSTNVIAVPNGKGAYIQGATTSGIVRDVYDVRIEYTGEGVGKLMAWSGIDEARTYRALVVAPFAHLSHPTCSSVVLAPGAEVDFTLEVLEGAGQCSIQSVQKRTVTFVPTAA